MSLQLPDDALFIWTVVCVEEKSLPRFRASFLVLKVWGCQDVFRALALGAEAVFVGRPVLWGLAIGG